MKKRIIKKRNNCRNINKKKINKIIIKYYEAYNYSKSLEWESAPSGEFTEYNSAKLEAEAITEVLESVLRILAPERIIYEN
jgi:hypothetical protein